MDNVRRLTEVHLAFLGLGKPFDKVPREGLLKKTLEVNNVEVGLKKAIQSFYKIQKLPKLC